MPLQPRSLEVLMCPTPTDIILIFNWWPVKIWPWFGTSGPLALVPQRCWGFSLQHQVFHQLPLKSLSGALGASGLVPSLSVPIERFPLASMGLGTVFKSLNNLLWKSLSPKLIKGRKVCENTAIYVPSSLPTPPFPSPMFQALLQVISVILINFNCLINLIETPRKLNAHIMVCN